MRDGVLESFLYSPVRSAFTFGYGGMDVSKQEEFEKKMTQHRIETQRNYIADKDQRNAYPGLEERQRRKQEQEAKREQENQEMKL